MEGVIRVSSDLGEQTVASFEEAGHVISLSAARYWHITKLFEPQIQGALVTIEGVQHVSIYSADRRQSVFPRKGEVSKTLGLYCLAPFYPEMDIFSNAEPTDSPFLCAGLVTVGLAPEMPPELILCVNENHGLPPDVAAERLTSAEKYMRQVIEAALSAGSD